MRMLRYFVRADKVDITNVTSTKYEDPENQLSDDDLEVGESTRVLASDMTEQSMENIVSILLSCSSLLLYLHQYFGKEVSIQVHSPY